jgi:4-amino-4-deoxy-L-arabinose transferase-like glycosyltransferase
VALWILAATAVVRLVVAAALPLFQDEAYYWYWSLRPDMGYFDHPPAIAWLIAPGPLLLGDTSLGVRLFPILAGLGSMVAVILLARRLAGPAGAERAAWLSVGLPVAVAGLLLATPDAPLFLFLALAMYGVDRALSAEPGSREDTAAWLLAGLALGGAFSSKYTGVLFPFGVTVAFLIHPGLRKRFATPGPWLGAALAVLLFLPVVLWNAGHEWASFAFQLGHGLGPTPDWSPLGALNRELELLGGQAGLVSPILFVLMVAAFWSALRDRTDERRFVLAVAGLVMFAFFMVSALQKRVEANWPALTYLPGIVLLAAHPWGEKGARWLRYGVALGLALGIFIHVQATVPVLPLEGARDPMAQAYGWDDLAAAVQERADGTVCDGRTWFAANRYQDAAGLAFALDGRPELFSLNLGRRPNQFDYWPGFIDRAQPGDCLVAVLGSGDFAVRLAEHVGAAFDSAEEGPRVDLARGDNVWARRRLYTFRGWTGNSAPFEQFP